MHLVDPVSDSILLMYGTPLFRRVWPEAARVNDGVCRLALARERQEAGVVHSNVGGWHSKANFLDGPEPELQVLRTWIRDAVLEITKFLYGAEHPMVPIALDGSGWANIVRRGGYHKMHNHAGATWSGVYYASTGEENDPAIPPDSGTIEFLDPRMAPALVPLPGPPTSKDLMMKPVPGLMLVFPGWLYHAVNLHSGDSERISVAFNVTLRLAASNP